MAIRFLPGFFSFFSSMSQPKTGLKDALLLLLVAMHVNVVLLWCKSTDKEGIIQELGRPAPDASLQACVLEASKVSF